MRSRHRTHVVAFALAASACARGQDAPRDTADTGATARDSNIVDSTTASTDVEWRVTPRGFGPVEAGMRLSEASAVLGVPTTAGGSGEACTIIHPVALPAGVSFMVVGDVVARVQVDSAGVTTDEGVGVGTTQAQAQTIYAGRVTSTPHEYTKGRYLTVRSAAPADSNFRMLFETDGQKITRYRVGRLPEVEWVEGCG
jgi:hypothetical protein